MVDKEIQNRIRQSINEELSISADVVSAAGRLGKEILDRLKNTPKRTIDRGLSEQSFAFYTTVFGMPLKVIAQCYNFFDEQTFNNLSEHYQYNSGIQYFEPDGIVFEIRFYRVNGTLAPDLFETIQHEIEHIYQEEVREDKRFLKDDELYERVTKYLNSEDKGLFYSAWLLYLSFEIEQDAKVNGLYAYLNNFGPMPSWSDIKNSDAYTTLTALYDGLEFLSTHDDIGDLVHFFGLDKEQIIQRGKKAVHRFENKIGKVLIKYRNGMIKRGVHFDFKLNEIKYFSL